MVSGDPLVIALPGRDDRQRDCARRHRPTSRLSPVQDDDLEAQRPEPIREAARPVKEDDWLEAPVVQLLHEPV